MKHAALDDKYQRDASGCKSVFNMTPHKRMNRNKKCRSQEYGLFSFSCFNFLKKKIVASLRSVHPSLLSDRIVPRWIAFDQVDAVTRRWKFLCEGTHAPNRRNERTPFPR